MNKVNLIIRNIAYTIAAECIEKNMFSKLRDDFRAALTNDGPFENLYDTDEADDLFEWVTQRSEEEIKKAKNEHVDRFIFENDVLIVDFVLRTLVHVSNTCCVKENLFLSYPLDAAMSVPDTADELHVMFNEDVLYLPILGSSLMVIIERDLITDNDKSINVKVTPVYDATTNELVAINATYGLHAGKSIPV